MYEKVKNKKTKSKKTEKGLPNLKNLVSLVQESEEQENEEVLVFAFFLISKKQIPNEKTNSKPQP